jgi:phage terminase large subunit-like protein
VRRSPGLDDRVRVKRGYREIQSTRHAGRIRVLAADVDTVDGVIPTLALVDELHRHRSTGLYGIFHDGLGARGGRMVTISTAGDSEVSPLGVMRAAARALPTFERDGAHSYARSADGAYAMHEWSLDRDDDLNDMTVAKLANPASWQTLDELTRRHDSPSMLPWRWARFACGIWQAAENWWIRADQWADAASVPPLRPGDRIALGFDGSRRGDSTALVACRLDDGMLALLGLWEKPEGVGDWEVPAGEVDARIAQAMASYQVARGYFDPPLWQSEVEDWHREYGAPAVLSFATYTRRMAAAVERFRTDLLAGTGAKHPSHPDLSRHVMNARTRENRIGYILTKPTDHSPEYIDAAIAAVLAYEARCDALADPPRRPGRLVTFS